MEITINYIAVILAALSTMMVGSIWYTPKVFGTMWMKLAKVKPNQTMTTKEMIILFGGAFASSLVTAFILAWLAGVADRTLDSNFLNTTLFIGLLCWLGFTAARIHMHDSFEGRRRKLTLLNVMHEFVTIMVMALIIGIAGI